MTQEVEEYFSCLLAFIDSTDQQITKPKNKEGKRGILFWKEEKDTL